MYQEVHQISASSLPEAWTTLRRNPEDYTHLGVATQNALLELTIQFSKAEWEQFWRMLCACGMEQTFAAAYYAKTKGIWITIQEKPK